MSSAIIIGKIISCLLRLFSSRGGTALPGLIALKLNPNFIRQLAEQNQLKSIIITGTNGKTTTSRLLGEVFKLQGINFIHNRSGSNLLRGIASTLINQSDGKGKIKTTWGIWEVDEAAVKTAVKQLQPEIILFTNLSRDQLDRYGEVDSILKDWQEAVTFLPEKAMIVTNQRLTSAFSKIRPLFTFPQHPLAKYYLNHQEAVKTICRILNFKPGLIERVVAGFRPAFGRGEELVLNQKPVKIFLVKNPAGFNAVWEMLHEQGKLNKRLLIILNDLIADGTDVSWIWDIDFNYLNLRKLPIIISGTRTCDMALRLKYAGLNPDLLKIEFDLKKALTYSPDYILPTYTAMLKLRQIIFQEKFD